MSKADKKLVLLVDDDDLVRLVTAEELRDYGFEVAEAGSGPEALTVLRTLPPIDVLFTDIRMPGALDGWDLAEQVRRLQPSVAVVYSSGYSATPARMVPGAHFLSKPYQPAQLVSVLSRLA